MKAVFTDRSGKKVFDAIGFGMGERIAELSPNALLDIVFSFDENGDHFYTSNGDQSIPQLRIRDFRLSTEQSVIN